MNAGNYDCRRLARGAPMEKVGALHRFATTAADRALDLGKRAAVTGSEPVVGSREP